MSHVILNKYTGENEAYEKVFKNMRLHLQNKLNLLNARERVIILINELKQEEKRKKEYEALIIKYSNKKNKLEDREWWKWQFEDTLIQINSYIKFLQDEINSYSKVVPKFDILIYEHLNTEVKESNLNISFGYHDPVTEKFDWKPQKQALIYTLLFLSQNNQLSIPSYDDKTLIKLICMSFKWRGEELIGRSLTSEFSRANKYYKE
ncbi:MAG: hypothetical protein WCT77_03355, partial [Bacteroidota bacterium]